MADIINLRPGRTTPSACFGAAIDDATVYRMERAASSKARGQQRRVTLVAVARDQQTLATLAREESAVWSTFASGVRAYREHALALLEVADAACARVEAVEAEISNV